MSDQIALLGYILLHIIFVSICATKDKRRKKKLFGDV